MSDAGVEALTLAYLRAHPLEASQIVEAAALPDAVRLLERTPARIGAGVLTQMQPGAAAQLLLALDRERAIALLTPLGTQALVPVVRNVPEPQRAQILATLPTATAVAARLLLGYPDDSVGSHVDPDVVSVPVGVSANEALDALRHAGPRVDRVFAVDSQRRLVGWVWLPALLHAPEAVAVASLLVEDSAVLTAAMPLAGARAHRGWLEHSALPVTTRARGLVGVLTRDALERALRRHSRDGAGGGQDTSLVEALGRAYWQGVSGLTQSLLPLLPSAPRIAELGDGR